MPELPEVETIVRGLRSDVEGRTIRDVRVIHDDVLAVEGADFAAEAGGRTIRTVRRRGKNVVLEVSGHAVVLVNLGMTGKLLPDPGTSGPSAPTHPALRFRFDDGGELVYDDVRRFGRVELLPRARWREREEALGREPLDSDFTADDLHALFDGSRSPIRSRLLDQARVAGIGNIYANESLFRARIHPVRPSRSLDREEAKRLHESLRAVLREAIDAGGTTVRDYRDANGARGRFGERLLVYGRTGEPCVRCGTSIRRFVFGSRSAFVCPRCQEE